MTEFNGNYIKKSKKVNLKSVKNVNLQLSENEYIYFASYVMKSNKGTYFSYEKYEGTKLKYKLTSDIITFKKLDSSYRLNNYYKRTLLEEKDIIEHGRRMDTVFSFMPKDLLHVETFAKEMRTPELLKIY